MFGVSGFLAGIIAILAGILILVAPDLLRWIVGLFLIIWGAIAISGRNRR